ncbi:MAG: Trk system potassium transporter TrkA [Lachnospiraceae bacterium]
MKIVIIGDGKVGYKLAKQLSEENYDIVLIDNNEGKLKEAINRLDIICITGDGASVEIQKEADVAHADLVIACASTDEFNMVACLLAKRIGAKHTIARVRNPIYYQQIDILKEDLHLSMAVNPELAVAGEIARVLLFPEASKVDTFVKGRMELVEFQIPNPSKIAGMTLAEIYQNFQIKVLVCAVKRGAKVLIPDGDFEVKAGDKLHVAATHREMELFFKSLGNPKNKVHKVIICGGGRVGFYLAKQLCALGMQIKIIERDTKKCEELCEALPKATIINGDAADHDLLVEEGIGKADALIALTGMDEENIIMGLFAKTQGVSKIIAKVNEDTRAQMVQGLGIDSIVSAKSATADVIMGYVRAKQNSLKSANVEALYYLLDGKVEALEFAIKEDAKYANIPLKNLPTKPDHLIACIGRDRRIIIPNGEDCIQVGDSVVVVTTTRKIQDIEEIFL